MLPIVWLHAARHNLAAILGFVAEHNPAAARRIASLIEDSVLRNDGALRQLADCSIARVQSARSLVEFDVKSRICSAIHCYQLNDVGN